MSIYSKEYKELSKRIRLARTEKKLTQTDFAKLLGVSQSFISKLENGQMKIDILLAKKITTILNIDINKIIS